MQAKLSNGRFMAFPGARLHWCSKSRDAKMSPLVTVGCCSVHDRLMTISFLAKFTDIALLMMRLMVGLIFFTSGWRHASNPAERSAEIEMSKGFTLFLGVVECAGALGVAFGVLTQFAALGLILVMLGAVQKKIFKWHSGFWGKHGTDGWSYDTMIILMNLVIATTGGGRFVLELLFQ